MVDQMHKSMDKKDGKMQDVLNVRTVKQSFHPKRSKKVSKEPNHWPTSLPRRFTKKPGSPSLSRTSLKCYNCGRPSHFSRECPQPRHIKACATQEEPVLVRLQCKIEELDDGEFKELKDMFVGDYQDDNEPPELETCSEDKSGDDAEEAEPDEYNPYEGLDPIRVRSTFTGSPSIALAVQIKQGYKVIELPALIDSGLTLNLINQKIVDKYQLSTTPLDQTIQVLNVDASHNVSGSITHACALTLNIFDQNACHQERTEFYVSNLGNEAIILATDWLSKHNLEIDWTTSTLTLSRCSNCLTDGTVKITSNEVMLCLPHLGVMVRANLFLTDRVQALLDKAPDVARTYHLHMLHSCRTISSILAEQAKARLPELTWDKIVPQEFHSFTKVFSKEESHWLPPIWGPDIDHQILLTPDAKPNDLQGQVPVYPLTQEERANLQEFIEQHLKSGYIVPSKSPYVTPVFFIKKKDGKPRLVQDYCFINSITVPDPYPLLLPTILLDQLHQSKYFTKLDVCWGYNNIRIHPEHQHLTAFKCEAGIFEPTVMFFGMRNSPATFVHFMNHIFQDLVRAGVLVVYMDDLLIHTKTKEEHMAVLQEILQRFLDNNLYL